ncbi:MULTISPECIES: 23S rRNA (uracil(1939)-C(5))-methyltransferase RlmD [unclassified Luteimonas]|uniref:23S rRNA (uracil(1939)-C(5))-methyltransferase RlmD n=1 Tax=unclassified Luteimonas TaxID=2629088 RepID=UPI001F1E4951|nr:MULTISPECIES: 23S rRNA (uracil(1939)-C(5))-methyltransferase RlmD [unclassified Luteimonas]
MARIDQTPFEAVILGLGPDGRGITRRPEGHPHAEKTVFIAGALPGERVLARQTRRCRRFDEAEVLEVIDASPDRVQPRCPHFGVCGACSLQHLAPARQVAGKARMLADCFAQAGVRAETELPPLAGALFGYRRKGRLSVRRVEKKGRTLVGFRERDARFVAELVECHSVVPQVGMQLGALSALVDGLDARSAIPQIEFSAGDDATALVFRHLEPLGEGDRAALTAFAQHHGFAIYLQPGGLETIAPLWPAAPRLSFRLAPWDVELAFEPLDFIQVNGDLNGKMIAHALELLDVQPGDRVLDLFCGLGNFSLPLGRQASEVVGVEGDAGLVERARANAARNDMDHVQFHVADLATDLSAQPWMGAGFDLLLLDPARAGALEVLQQLPLQGLRRIVYVSCNPETLARDAAYLVGERGWRMPAAGVMDMFPHTAHVESIAVFEPA